MLKASMGCPWVGQNEKKKRQKWEVNEILSVTHICTQKMSFLSGFKSTWYMLLILWSTLEIKMFFILGFTI
jgi:hypothetical protein